MNYSDYKYLQERLSALIKKFPDKHRYYNRREREAYEEAVLACKSILSEFNPEREDKNAKRVKERTAEIQNDVLDELRQR